MSEKWVDVKGYEGLYMVSDQGRVWSVPRLGLPGKGGGRRNIGGRYLKPQKRFSGHLHVNLSDQSGNRKTWKIHILVMESFNGERPPGMFICHNDGNPLNNHLDNLRWDTPKGNANDRVKHGTAHRGEKSPKTKLSDKDVIKMREERADGAYVSDLAQKYNVSEDVVGKICSGANWKYTPGPITKDGLRKFVVKKGSEHSSAKLNEESVVEIRKRVNGGEKYKDIAKDYGVDKTLIGYIHRRVIWKHVE